MSVSPPIKRELSPGEVAETLATPQKEEWVQNLNLHLICPQCQESPPNLAEEFSAGDIVCASCGLVLQTHIVDTRSEWRTFANDDQSGDDPSRVGDAGNPLYDTNQLATTIAYSPDARSRDLGRAQSKSSNEKGSKNLNTAFKNISDLCASFQLGGSVEDTAKHLYKLTDQSKQFKGKSQDAVIASCIFIACRQNSVPRTFKEIMGLTKVPKKEIGRTFKLLEKFFHEWTKKNPTQSLSGMTVKTTEYQVTESTKASELCARFCNILGLPANISIIAKDCAVEMSRKGLLAGRSPLSIASVAIYMITHLMGVPKSAKEIGEAAGVSDGTIRTAYKNMFNLKETVIKTEWLEKGGKQENLPAA